MDKVSNKQLCPASISANIFDPTEQSIKELLETDEDNISLLFFLGTLYVRKLALQKAIATLKRAISLDPKRADIRCNLGIAYELHGKREEAISELAQAILLDSQLELAHLSMGRVQALSKDFQAALSSFEKLLEFNPKNFEANVCLAKLLEQKENTSKALTLYKKAFEINPNNTILRNRLGEIKFLEGKLCFQNEKYDEAFKIWGYAFHKYSPAFATSQEIVRSMRELVDEFNKKGLLKKTLSDYRWRLKAENLDSKITYKLFCYYYFSINLIPDAYEAWNRLEDETKRWQDNLTTKGNHPYPHFRLGLIYSYQGKLEEATEELEKCRDQLPAKKRRSLKLDIILDFMSDLQV